ncbi:MAG TPA: single-stranded-DNA-specific exonuclease RecJ [Thermomicrobiaceae bacterium]|nr:single-stranded-DNA-specific exonuclease RecJ [Thermomicrobiaceae bacterium]
MPPYRWIEPRPNAQLDDFGLDSPLLAAILARRGVGSAAQAAAFLAPELGQLGDPYDLPDLDLAVARIRAALRRGTPIAVFGDYDADGVSATAMLVRALRGVGGQVRPVLPHRVRDGYGLNRGAVGRIAADGAGLLIAVDCGTGNAAELALAHQHGLATIVLDHHHVVDDELPGTAFVSSHRPGARGFRDFCAAGVTFQLVRALLGDDEAQRYLPLAALATVADVVPLLGANRAIVALGLARFTQAQPGLLALARQAGVRPEALSSRDLGFALGPRINAAGRIDDPGLALDLLLTEERSRALELAQELGRLNAERQRQVEALLREAEEVLASPEEQPLIVVSHPGWNVGLVGLAASRLSERYGRPALVLAEENGRSRGSARSIAGFNIVEALGECHDLLEAYGGHSQAAGLTLRSERRAELVERLHTLAGAAFGPLGPRRELTLDAELTRSELTLASARLLRRLEPLGHGNPAPRLLLRGARLHAVQPTRDGKHLRFRVAAERGRSVKGIYFGGAERADLLSAGRPLDLALTLKLNTWNGAVEPEVELLDARLAAGEV